MDDIRIAEYEFLLLVRHSKEPGGLLFNPQAAELKALSVKHEHLIEMAVYLLEAGAIYTETHAAHLLVARLRGEYVGEQPSELAPHQWRLPREALINRLRGQNLHALRITYGGLRRIEELRETLQRERILDPLGVLLDWRYFLPDLRAALLRDAQVGVIALDLDGFKRINDDHGHDPGDAVLKAFMEAVRVGVAPHGRAYRRGGDEVRALMVGRSAEECHATAEAVRVATERLQVHYEGVLLPTVTTSIGLAVTPPEERQPTSLDRLADLRQGEAKRLGKNRIITR